MSTIERYLRPMVITTPCQPAFMAVVDRLQSEGGFKTRADFMAACVAEYAMSRGIRTPPRVAKQTVTVTIE